MIRGKRNYFKCKLEIAVGKVIIEDQEKIMAGPIDSVKHMASKYIILEPGSIKKSDIARSIAKANKMNYFNDPDDFFKSDIDAVLIMVPHFLHEQYVIAAAEAGKHVLCEKPMATTLEGCDQMIKATEKAGVKFMIAENHRFLPAHDYIVNAVQSGLIGNPFLVRSYEGVNEIPGLMREGYWKGHPILAGLGFTC